MGRWLGAAVAVVGAVIAYEFAPYWAVPLSVGGGLVLTALVLPVRRPSGLMKEGHMDIEQMLNDPLVPRDWNESRISLDIKELVKQSAFGLLQSYVEGITDRFVIGQDQQTIVRRTEFLKLQSNMIVAMIENYKLRREAGRSRRKEDLVDKRTDLDEKKIDQDSELSDYEHALRVEKLKTAIAKERQERKGGGKPLAAEPRSSDSRSVSAAERIRAEREALDARIRRIREEIAITEKNPNLSEEEKHPYVNMLRDQMSSLQEKYVQTL